MRLLYLSTSSAQSSSRYFKQPWTKSRSDFAAGDSVVACRSASFTGILPLRGVAKTTGRRSRVRRVLKSRDESFRLWIGRGPEYWGLQGKRAADFLPQAAGPGHRVFCATRDRLWSSAIPSGDRLQLPTRWQAFFRPDPRGAFRRQRATDSFREW